MTDNDNDDDNDISDKFSDTTCSFYREMVISGPIRYHLVLMLDDNGTPYNPEDDELYWRVYHVAAWMWPCETSPVTAELGQNWRDIKTLITWKCT